MPALNFQSQFAQKILSGSKIFTLRALRPDGRDPKTGQRLYLYTAMRTKKCKLIAERPCPFAVTIRLCFNWISIPTFLPIVIPEHLEIFSKADGFDDYAGFCAFHKIEDGMSIKEIRLIAWVPSADLKHQLSLEDDL